MKTWLKRIRFSLGDILIVFGALMLSVSSIMLATEYTDQAAQNVSRFEALMSILVLLLMCVSFGYRDNHTKEQR